MKRSPKPFPVVADRAGLKDLMDRSARRLAADEACKAAAPGWSSLERLLALAQTMNRIHDREPLLTHIRDGLRELFDAANSEVVLVGRDGSLQVLEGASSGQGRNVSRTLVRRVVEERVPILVDDASQDPELRDKQSVLDLGLVSVLCAPLLVEEHVIGVILFDHRNEPRRFSDGDLTLLSLFANQAATALDNVLLGEQREEALQKMRKAQSQLVATERLRALGQMAAGVAHDFNNLLASMLGLSELLLLRPNTPSDLRQTLERLHGCALDGAETVRRIQRFAGGSAGDDDLEHVDLNRVVLHVVGSCAALFESAPGDEERRLVHEEGAPPTVRARASDLRDVVRNLVLNARDALPEGGTVTVRTRERGGRAVLEVEDTGVGIPPEIREKIFEPFFTTKSGRGHGLGLSICWGMVERWGGSIHVHPGRDAGTVFTLDLPAAPPEEPVAPSAPPAEAVEDAVPRRVLLVEDDAMVREVVECLLSAMGHDVMTASGGTEALELLEHAAVDVVVTDHGMPGMNGVELATEIRRRAPELPIVLLTGRCPDRFEDPVRDVVDVILAKPITGKDLDRAIERVLAV